MEVELTWMIVLGLVAAGFVAGFIDSIAGGGGLISLPVLFWAGLPAQWVLGTNKLQAMFGTLLAVLRFARAGLVSWRQVRVAVGVTFAASLVGTWVVTQVSNEVLGRVVPWLLLAVAVYVLLSPKIGSKPGKAVLSAGLFAWLVGAVLGFYDGFFGPGTGAFWTLACVGLLGLDLPRATGYTKAVNLTSNAASMLIFVGAGMVRYDFAGVMIVGQLLGARLGSGLVLQHGAGLIRVMFVLVVVAMVLRLFWM